MPYRRKEVIGVTSRMAKLNSEYQCDVCPPNKRVLTSTGLRSVTFTVIGPAVMTFSVRVGVSSVETKLLG